VLRYLARTACRSGGRWCARGFPKIDALMGGRYTPAVRAYFDHQYGLDRDRSGDAPLAPDGVEDFEAWKQKRRS
jgi:hypothetical protein